MQETFLTFQKFNNEEIANDLVKKLTENNIQIEIEDNNKFFDPTFASNPLTREIRIKLRANDFETAQKILETHYRDLIDSLEDDYYLFEFTDQELIEIVMKPDEWGDFDYQIAQKILRDRGKEIKPEVVNLMRKQRNEDLAKPETSNRFIVYAGYVSAFLGGIFGLLVGWHLSNSKKTLPDGRSVHRYSENEINHGNRILLIGIICLIIWIGIRLLLK